MTSLTTITLRAGFWSALERVGQQVVLVLTQLWLARLLGPELFGLVAMLTIFYSVAQVIVDGGLGNALIQKNEIDEVDCNSVFYFNVVLGFVLAGLICVASPWIAAFYGRPVLMPMTCVLALIPLINGFGIVQMALLRRELRFKRILLASVPATVLSGALGVGMALAGFGVWALVAQMVGLRLFWVVLIWIVSDWRPRLRYSARSIKRMFGFGSKLMLENVLTVIFEDVYFLVVGKIFDAITLGLYFNARRLQRMVATTVSGMLARVALPVFAQIQDDPDRMKRGMRRGVRLVILLNGLICALMVATAEPLFRGVLGDKWIGSIPYFQWLAAVALFYPLSAVNLNVLVALGRSDLFLGVGVVKKVLIALNLVIAWRWGVMAIVYGQVAIAFASFLINAYYTGRFLRYSALAQLWDGVGGLLAAGSSAVVMAVLAQLGRGLPHLVIVAGQVVVGVGFWAVVCFAFDLRAFHDFTNLLRNRSKPNG